ncbi:glucosamine-6-phosphate deaminase [Alkaliphilus sp. B6464]|uniref:glucosamine-6-phosphate deaminase n=1 Tax=Alkaliphilus sp. B6464 TaxID=2731219 RepID=UPI001BA47CA5|nr:glucosamine-6-phosphate deaminase [Alkaliphilus sp. B6464]QUH18823.1 glucosamine-6-phosphate deaminase [Alkaliphilus sp. B6464]
MKIYIEENYEQVSKRAALIMASQVVLKPDSVLGLATGSTPIGMYEELIAMYKRGEIDFSNVTTFNLDEYYKLPIENENSYYSFMMNTLFNHINVKKENIHLPNGMTESVEEECKNYEEKIKEAGGIDMQLLGIGGNAHIGFNEPAYKLSVDTDIVDLTQKTIKDNSRFFDNEEDVPKKAISMGIGSIMKAKKIILLASGEGKAEAIRDMTNGYINTKVPASILQAHPDVTLIIDKDAAKLIK